MKAKARLTRRQEIKSMRARSRRNLRPFFLLSLFPRELPDFTHCPVGLGALLWTPHAVRFIGLYFSGTFYLSLAHWLQVGVKLNEMEPAPH